MLQTFLHFRDLACKGSETSCINEPPHIHLGLTQMFSTYFDTYYHFLMYLLENLGLQKAGNCRTVPNAIQGEC